MPEIDFIKKKIRDYVSHSVHAEAEKVKDNTLIFKDGFMDSMGFMQLITFLEEDFKLRINDSDLIEDNFESIDAITGFVNSKSA